MLFLVPILILCRCHAETLLEALAEVARVVNTYHIGDLRHVELAGFYEIGCTLNTHFFDEFYRS